MPIQTYSICNKCFKKIPAEIFVYKGGVFMNKECCDMQISMLEPDAEFYMWMKSRPYKDIMGTFCNIAITDKCNTSCEACYCTIQDSERDVRDIIGLANSSPSWLTKFILTGGEPTTHMRFFDIVGQLDCGLITNGIAFSDMRFLQEYIQNDVYTDMEKCLSMMFSLNCKDSPDYDLKLQALENFKILGLKAYMVSATITDIDQIPLVLDEFEKLKDSVYCFKIRSAFNIGAEQDRDHIYMSDMYKYVNRLRGITPIEGLNNNTYLINTKCNDMHLILVKCPDKTIIDLNDIGPTGPYQYTHYDTLEDVMVALIINEGIENGYFNGRKIQWTGALSHH